MSPPVKDFQDFVPESELRRRNKIPRSRPSATASSNPDLIRQHARLLKIDAPSRRVTALLIETHPDPFLGFASQLVERQLEITQDVQLLADGKTINLAEFTEGSMVELQFEGPPDNLQLRRIILRHPLSP